MLQFLNFGSLYRVVVVVVILFLIFFNFILLLLLSICKVQTNKKWCSRQFKSKVLLEWTGNVHFCTICEITFLIGGPLKTESSP